MITITNPNKTIAKIPNLSKTELLKYENTSLKALKNATGEYAVIGDKQITIPALTAIINALDEEYNARFVKKSKKNVKKVLHKNVEKPIDKPKKNCYINNTNKTTTTNKKENNTMNKNEINSLVKTVTIAPNAVKKIMVAQKKNKTNTDARYWGGWATVRTGMNAAYNDYEKYQNLETEWLELRNQLGGMKSDKYHFCWGLINKNRVGVKQEPNATLRFIKNVKIRIAMAKDVLANKYSRSEIASYMNGLSMNYKIKYGLV